MTDKAIAPVKDTKTRKSPVYKATLKGLTQQIKDWEVPDIKSLQKVLETELAKRKAHHEQALKELEGGV